MHPNIRPTVALLLGLAACAGLAPSASAQSVLVDRGAFRLTMAGREAGRDSFDIVRTASGADTRIQARGWLDAQGRRVTSVVETTGSYALTAYQATISGEDAAEVRALVSGRRLEMTVRSPAGEQMLEARAPAGAVLLEPNVAHQYYFVGVLASEGASIPVIVPRASGAPPLQVQSITPERLSIGGQPVEARRIGLVSDGVERRLWVDAQGRVLRLEIPSTGFLAERTRPPA